MMRFTEAIASLLFATLLALVARPVTADVSVANSLSSQWPQLAHRGQDYVWTFSSSTFNTTSSDSTLTYNASGLPSWANFDAQARTFEGTPSSDDDIGNSTVTVMATDSSGDSATDQFDLLAVWDPAPTLRRSLVRQLPTASSLGRAQIIDGTILHIPYGWSFSVGWVGSTFTLESGNTVYTAGTINGYEPLPSWLKYSSSTYAMWGIAPVSPQAEGTQFQFCLTGSNEEGYAGTQTCITIVLGEGKLSVADGGLSTVTAAVETPLNVSFPIQDILIDGSPVVNGTALNLTADTSLESWLTFDPDTKYFSGTPPNDGSTTMVNMSIPCTVTSLLSGPLAVTLPLIIYPAAFSSSELPTIRVEAGQQFLSPLASYISDSNDLSISASYNPSNASSWISFDSSTYIISGTAPSDLTSDESVLVTLTNGGSNSTTSTASLSKRQSDSQGQATFYIALEGANVPTGHTGGSSGSGGLSSRSDKILGGVFGGLLGLLLLLLLICCIRRRRNQDKDEGRSRVIMDHNGRSPAMSEKTLYSEASPGFGLKGLPFTTKKLEKDSESPVILGAGSPEMERKSGEKKQQQQGSQLRGILIGGRTYQDPTTATEERQMATTDSRPRQLGLMSSLVAGAKKKFPSSRSLTHKEGQAMMSGRVNAARSKNAQQHRRSNSSLGLGLVGVDGVAAEDEMAYQGQAAAGPSHSRSRSNAGAGQGYQSRSRHSMRSEMSKESWEEDLFYTNADVERSGSGSGSDRQVGPSNGFLQPITEDEEVPRRRSNGAPDGYANGLTTTRQRQSHNATSPCFTTDAAFAHPASDESLRQYDQSAYHDHTQDDLARAGSAENFVIGTAHRVDVRELQPNGTVKSHRPDIKKAHHRSNSSRANALERSGSSGHFDDAEDENQIIPIVSIDHVDGGLSSARPLSYPYNDRQSKADSVLLAMSPYLVYPDDPVDAPAQAGFDPSVAFGSNSPRPNSIFGGASIQSGTRPEDTLRAIPTQDQIPSPQLDAYMASPGPRGNLERPLTPDYTGGNNNSNRVSQQIAYYQANRPPSEALPPRPKKTPIIPHREEHIHQGDWIRLPLTPANGPSMVGGAPGSPGKRSSGRKVGKYLPVLADVNLKQYGTWPNWLNEWLFWDNQMFELSGEVPINFVSPRGEEEGLRIALVKTTSNVGGTSILAEGEVVAYLTLYVHPPKMGSTGSGGHIVLQRSGGESNSF